MKLSLNVNEDEKLRKEVKSIVKTAIDGILKDEVKAMVNDVIQGNKERFSAEKLEKFAIDNLRERIKFFAGSTNGWRDDNVNLRSLVASETAKMLEAKRSEVEIVIEKQVAMVIKEITEAKIEKMIDERVKSVILGKLK